jgi:drug/metabolite transporter (DMT)-like permease
MKKAFLQLHFAILLAGFTGILGRLISLNEGMLVWYRLFFTAIFLWIIRAFSKEKGQGTIRTLWPLYAVGGIVALHWVFFYGSIKYANVSIGLVLLFFSEFFHSYI